MQKTKTKLTEFVISGKSIYILKLVTPLNKYFGEFLLPLFNSTWDSIAEAVKQLVIIISACYSKIKGGFIQWKGCGNHREVRSGYKGLCCSSFQVGRDS